MCVFVCFFKKKKKSNDKRHLSNTYLINKKFILSIRKLLHENFKQLKVLEDVKDNFSKNM